ncbi:transketolase C-terminal domain-containing protein [Mycobacterium sp. ACS4331]|uniref:alpha-ketoacid dehydrogenase subunit beta n=1 Tax=Mycobacterium sp. ACS4331 TaxID=1834121 RepID=UPI0007FD2378|nr:transketolase C-terminal domain-containing protein [Mycobacterium sp. ACS4331]OBF13734.1 hypothetical protein A5727_16910 [Mycobacterium sp. ACS4331]
MTTVEHNKIQRLIDAGKKVRLTQAISAAIAAEMRTDDNYVLWGEDVRIGVNVPTKGLFEEFGPERIVNTPISEATMVGGAVGAALAGMRPIVDLMYSSFTYVAFDQLVNQAGRMRYMTGGQASVPITVIAASGVAGSNAAQHSESPYPMFMNATGLRIVFPSTPHQAYWLTRAALRSEDPFLVLHHPSLGGARGEVGPELAVGHADVLTLGADVTVVASGLMASRARAVAHRFTDKGIGVEVVDLCSLSPLPTEDIIASARKTGRVVVVDEARMLCSVASEVAAIVQETCFSDLRAPVRRLAVANVPIPYAPMLEKEVIPSEDQIEEAVVEVLNV